MTVIYIEFPTETIFNAKMSEQDAYLGFPRPHCLDNQEVPSVTWDEKSGHCGFNLDPLVLTVILTVNEEQIYNAHTSNPTDPYWKSGIFNGLKTYNTLQELADAGYPVEGI